MKFTLLNCSVSCSLDFKSYNLIIKVVFLFQIFLVVTLVEEMNNIFLNTDDQKEKIYLSIIDFFYKRESTSKLIRNYEFKLNFFKSSE